MLWWPIFTCYMLYDSFIKFTLFIVIIFEIYILIGNRSPSPERNTRFLQTKMELSPCSHPSNLVALMITIRRHVRDSNSKILATHFPQCRLESPRIHEFFHFYSLSGITILWEFFRGLPQEDKFHSFKKKIPLLKTSWWCLLKSKAVSGELQKLCDCKMKTLDTEWLQVEVVGYPHSGCLPRGRVGSAPLVTGWFNTIMVQSGDTVRLACQVSVGIYTTLNCLQRTYENYAMCVQVTALYICTVHGMLAK